MDELIIKDRDLEEIKEVVEIISNSKSYNVKQNLTYSLYSKIKYLLEKNNEE